MQVNDIIKLKDIPQVSPWFRGETVRVLLIKGSKAVIESKDGIRANVYRINIRRE